MYTESFLNHFIQFPKSSLQVLHNRLPGRGLLKQVIYTSALVSPKHPLLKKNEIIFHFVDFSYQNTVKKKWSLARSVEFGQLTDWSAPCSALNHMQSAHHLILHCLAWKGTRAPTVYGTRRENDIPNQIAIIWFWTILLKPKHNREI